MSLFNTKKTAIFGIAVLCFALSALGGPVEQYGRIYANGNKIVGKKSGGEAVQLKGPSMQWSVVGWGSDKFFLDETVNALVDGWNAQIIRVPLGISGGPDAVEDGYNIDPVGNWERVERVADAAIARGVYVIVDWHSHSAADNPNETALAAEFFTNADLAGKYGNNPAVIFEIFNEPVRGVAWSAVKTHADAVIKAIRDKGFNNLIVVGSPYYSAAPNMAAADPPADPQNNIALTFHFYANAHKINSSSYFGAGTYRSVVQYALDEGFPVFVTEWGTNDATEKGASNFVETDKWHAYLDSNKISSCAWGVTAGAYYGENVLDYWSRWGNPLHFDYGKLSDWTDPFRMTPHGRYIYRWLTGKDTTHAPTSSWPEFAGLSTVFEFPPVTSAKWNGIKNENGNTELSYNITEDGTLSISYTLDKGTYAYDPYIGVQLETGELSRCEYGIGYSYKGGAHALRVEQSNVTDWDYHINYKTAPASTNGWVDVRIPWGYFWQEEWGGVQTAERDNSLIERITWYITGNSGASGELSVKNAQCLGDPDGSEYLSVRRNLKAPQANGGSYIRTSNRHLHLRLANAGKIDIFNLKGGKLRTVKLKKGAHALKMNNLPKGTYIVKASIKGTWSQSVRMVIR